MTKVIHEQFEELLEYITPTKGTTRLLKELLKRQVRQELGNVNEDIGRVRSALSENDTYRQQTIKKFITEKITEADKKLAMREADAERLILQIELAELEKKQTISESSIETALNFMGNICEHWKNAPLELKQAYQELVFPTGFVYSIKDRKFITPDISPLYRVDLGESEATNAKYFSLVISRRIELRLPG
jgi:hypothetical protein